MFHKLLEKLIKLNEQMTAPAIPKPTTPTEPTTPVRKPKRRRRTPLKPSPGVHPKPKASGDSEDSDELDSGDNIDVELFKKARLGLKEMAFDPGKYPSFIHPEKKGWIETGDPELDELLPKMGDEEKTYLEMITSKSYQDMISRLEKYTGISAEDLSIPQVMSIVMQSLSKAMEIEKAHKKELEELAVELVMNLPEYEMVKEAWENGEFDVDIRLAPAELDVTELEDTEEVEVGELSQEEKFNMELASIFDGVTEKSLRRRLANLLIQGSATLKLYLFNLVNKELQEIDESLPSLYGVLATVAQFGYWVTPFGIERSMAAVGSEEVIPKGDDYIIKVRALVFPYLVHELVKGIAEWISIDPLLRAEMARDSLEKETEDIIVGPELFKVLTSYIAPGDQKLIHASGKAIMKELIDQAREMWEDYEEQKREEELEYEE